MNGWWSFNQCCPTFLAISAIAGPRLLWRIHDGSPWPGRRAFQHHSGGGHRPLGGSSGWRHFSELSRSTLFGCGQCGAFDPHQLPQLHLGSANIRFGWHLLHRQCRGRQSLLDLHFGPSGAPQKSLSYEHNNILQIASFKLKHSQPEKLRDADHCELASACVETIRCAPWTTPSTWSSSNWLLADAKLLSLWVDVWATTT